MSIFQQYEIKAWPFMFAGSLHIGVIAGGTPTDPQVAKGWLQARVFGKEAADDLLRAAVAETMAERGVSSDEAVTELVSSKTLNGFKRDPERGLYIEGRQLKAAIKEAANVAVATGKLKQQGWGITRKWALGFIAEHVCVVEDRIYLGVNEPTGVNQRFVQSRHGSAIQYEEYVSDAKVDFTIKTDHEFTAEQWAMIWLTGQEQGIGASRSQGYGRYEVTRWDRVEA